MSLPEVVQRELGNEDPVTRVPLGGDDELFVTATRTLIYRAEGLLSDESVESYAHDAERVSVSESRRKARISLDYGLDGDQSFQLPRKSLRDVLHPVLAGVLSAAGITDPGETVERTFRFSELTLVVTSERLVKHVGAAVWDDEYEEYHYDDVTDIDFEEGSVSTSIVLTANGRQERFKTPSEETRAVRETLTNAILDHYDVRTLDAFREQAAEEEPSDDHDSEEEAALGSNVDFGDGPDPLSADPVDVEEPDNGTRTDAGGTGDHADPTGTGSGVGSGAVGSAGGGGAAGGAGGGGAAGSGPTGAGGDPIQQTEADPAEMAADAAAEAEADAAGSESDGSAGTDAFAGSEFQPATPDDDLVEEVAELRRTVEDQQRELSRQADLIEQLIEELRRGR
jgi:hypothetical protein